MLHSTWDFIHSLTQLEFHKHLTWTRTLLSAGQTAGNKKSMATALMMLMESFIFMLKLFNKLLKEVMKKAPLYTQLNLMNWRPPMSTLFSARFDPTLTSPIPIKIPAHGVSVAVTAGALVQRAQTWHFTSKTCQMLTFTPNTNTCHLLPCLTDQPLRTSP